MSFFGGFVSGVFQGMDWREGRDERARQRDIRDTRWTWEQEDRALTVEERERARRRRAAAEAEAARNAALNREIGAALADTMADERRGGGAGSAAPEAPRPMSIRPPAANAPENATPAAAAAAAPAPTTPLPAPTQSLGVTGDVARPRINRNSGKSNTTSPRVPEGSGDAPSLPPEAREIGLLQGLANNARTTPERYFEGMSEADRAALIQRGQRPQVQGSRVGPEPATMPEGGRGVNPSYREMTPDQELARMRAAEMVAPPSAAPATQPVPMSTGQAPVDMATDPPPAQAQRAQPQRPITPTPPRAGAPTGGAFGVASAFVTPEWLSGVEAPENPAPIRTAETDPGIRQQEREASAAALADHHRNQATARLAALRERGEQLRREAASTTDPQRRALLEQAASRTDEEVTERMAASDPGSVAPTQSPAVTPETTTDRQRVTGPVERRARAQADGTEAAQSAVQTAVNEVLPGARAQAVSNGRERMTPQEQRAVEVRASRALQEDHLQPIIDRLLRSGDIRRAQALIEWRDQREVQAAMRTFIRGTMAAEMGDSEGFLSAMIDLANNRAYYDNGLSIVREQTNVGLNERGEMAGTITFRDERTGRTFQQPVQAPARVFMATALGIFSPQEVINRGMAAMDAGMQETAPAGPTDEIVARLMERAENIVATDRSRTFDEVLRDLVSYLPSSQRQEAWAALQAQRQAGRGNFGPGGVGTTGASTGARLPLLQ